MEDDYIKDYEEWINDHMMDEPSEPDKKPERPPDEDEPLSPLEKMRGDGIREAKIKRNSSYTKLVSGVFIVLAAYIAIMMLIKTHYNPVTVVGSSMSPTLESGEILRTSKDLETIGIFYDSIICFKKDRSTIIKRVVGLPGDEISFKKGKVYINGKEREENFPLMEEYPDKIIKLKDDEYYVLGDNRNNSQDSRVFGPVHKSEITGVVIFNATKEKENFNQMREMFNNLDKLTPSDASETDSY